MPSLAPTLLIESNDSNCVNVRTDAVRLSVSNIVYSLKQYSSPIHVTER